MPIYTTVGTSSIEESKRRSDQLLSYLGIRDQAERADYDLERRELQIITTAPLSRKSIDLWGQYKTSYAEKFNRQIIYTTCIDVSDELRWKLDAEIREWSLSSESPANRIVSEDFDDQLEAAVARLKQRVVDNLEMERRVRDFIATQLIPKINESEQLEFDIQIPGPESPAFFELLRQKLRTKGITLNQSPIGPELYYVVID